MLGRLFKLALVLWVGYSAWVMYQQWSPEQCAPETGQPCITPLFPALQKVDVYVYTTTQPQLAWRRDFAKLIPLWNATGLDTALGANATVAVPLPDSVRRNGSLYAHVFVVREGERPDPASHQRDPRSALHAEYAEYRSLLHAEAALTRTMRPIARERSNLLADAVDGSKASVRVPLPFGQSIEVHPSGAMVWCGISFAALGMLKPSVAVALLRYSMVPAVAYLYQKQLELASAEEHAAERTAALLLRQPPAPAVAHWTPLLVARLVRDDSLYPADAPPPKLYDEVSLDSSQNLN